MQRKAVGNGVYTSMLLLNPTLLASLAAALTPSATVFAWAAAVVATKAALDESGRAAPDGSFSLTAFAAAPLKDLLLGWTWLAGAARDHVEWRGNRLVVGAGTRLSAPPAQDRQGESLDEAA